MTGLFRKLFGKKRDRGLAVDEAPFVGELFSVGHLEQHAALIATEHEIFIGRGRGRTLLARLADNEHILVNAYQTLADAIRRERSLSPAAEWLVDNFHLVEEQLREIREDLPEGYYRELPKLKKGELADYPRIYAIALAVISHTDCRLDVETLKGFLRAYQRETPLCIGELWAFAITLRVALVENLRRLAARIVAAREQRDAANTLADRLLEQIGQPPRELISFVSKRVREPDPAFVVQLTQRLHDQDPGIAQVLDWLDQQLVRKGQSTGQIVQLEHQRQAATQVTVANIIISMRLLSTLDWREFFESVSLIDPLLSSDPAGAYALMDFATRDHYRHVIERLSRRTGIAELDIAGRALQLAQRAQQPDPENEASAHVGYYLIDQGLADLERAVAFQLRIGERAGRLVQRHLTLAYLGSIVIVTTLLIALLAFYADYSGAKASLIMVLALLSLIPASELATSVVNWMVTSIVRPRSLPKMETSFGVSVGARTMVLIPTMLTDEESIRELLERLEVHYLANQDAQFYFALLTDFSDAPNEKMSSDQALVEQAWDGLTKLNARYCLNGLPARFHLFHRRRQWNAGEGKWIGWERKRGKLSEFNLLLRGAADTSFIITTAEPAVLAKVRYVITLDSDTRLPHGTARQLVGAISHPLNRPQFDPRLGRVTRGYAILQPRIGISLESGSRSRFAHLFSGNTGIDPYTTAVSDVYQDLFGEGIYTGKGIYDVHAFEASLEGRIPENSLLSHDLFEGLFARTALVTDIELLDDYPTQYDAHARRQHRWTRGDWQAAALAFSRPKNQNTQADHNRLSLISCWKVIDNLRRSLIATSVLLWLVVAWTALPGSTLLWTLFILLTLAFPAYAHLTRRLLIKARGVPWTNHVLGAWSDLRVNTSQALLNVTFSAHQASLMIDAIVRTIYRELISHRRLLEWVTAAQDGRVAARDRFAFLRFMLPAPAIAVGVTVLILVLRPESIFVATPFLLLWGLSPIIAHWISQPVSVAAEPLRAEEVRYARLLARRTWRFFETFVGEEDHWLPPDNYQEDPEPVIAHRTSPTNVGLLLLSTVAAHDFGFLASLELIERLELTFTALEKLPRFRGHFFNWYDTRTLEPLTPQYVSTVDGGNLAGALIVTKQACIQLAYCSIFDERVTNGLADTIKLMSDEVKILGAIRQRTDIVTVKQLCQEVDTCVQLVLSAAPRTVSQWASFLALLSEHATTIQDMVNALTQEHGAESFVELRFWIGTLLHQIQALTRDLQALTPWADGLMRISATLDDANAGDFSGEVQKIRGDLDIVPTAATIPGQCDRALIQLAELRPRLEQRLPPGSPKRGRLLGDLDTFTKAIESAAEVSKTLLARINSIARLCDGLVDEMDFGFLFDERLKVLTIGYNVSEGRRDNSYYDLLASEARLASFLAIATGDVPQEHWFRLGRQLTSVSGRRALISWSATMFEYLMPLLIMRNYGETLLAETYRTVVTRQIAYGRLHGVPWGISESAYNARDTQLTYQYGPFGIPGLGLKRGLSENLVVAPYATLLAAMIEPRAAFENLARLEREGALARFGFYEAIDFTPERLPPHQTQAVVHAFMTHHQGMSLVALDNLLFDRVMQSRFHAEALVRANELLLQERVSPGVPITHPRAEEVLMSRTARTLPTRLVRRYGTVDLPSPRTQLLSNGTYSVMLTTAGGGYSMCGPVAVTRWREDTTRDNWGSFCYLRDVRSGASWSSGYQPTLRAPQFYEISFSEDKVDIWRHDVGLITQTEIIVSSEDNAELRRVSITNQSSREREIELTSYAEVVLAPSASEAAHPAFNNLFIETEFIADKDTLLARRRPRSEDEEPIWGVHTVVTQGEVRGGTQYETDRSRFVGRGRSTAEPVVITEDRLLSNTCGGVLDPIFSLRQRLLIQPNATVRVTFATAIAGSREEALRLADKYYDARTFEREARLAWTKSQVEMRHLEVDQEETQLFQRLAGRVLYADPALRPRPQVLALNSKTQTGLWPYGISGDLPIILVRISEARDLRTVRQILRAHEYLRHKGLSIDLVILNDHPASYAQSLQDDLVELVRKSEAQQLVDKPGGIFLRRTDIMPEADRILLYTVARVCIVMERGSLEDQLSRSIAGRELPPPFIPRWSSGLESQPAVVAPDLIFFNGLGGFSKDGREYVTILGEGQWTPAPWLNVIANGKEFGFQISETGAGYTWSVNSRENRLTPWSNDGVCDPPGEAIYLRDEDSGVTWTPTPLPIREASSYVIRHGQGYTVFEHTSHGIAQDVLMFVPTAAPVKIARLRLHNRTTRKRRLSVTSYHELVLGTQRSASAPFIITEVDQTTGAILARNPYNNEFARRVAFVEMSERERTVTCDRKEFLGRNGSLARPAALRRTRLSGATGAGLDPCVAMQAVIELGPDETREIVLLFGEGKSPEEARLLINRYREISAVRDAFAQVVSYWNELLGTIEVDTPDTAMNVMLNRWLLYQTLTCRVWARAAFYQSGGAYGFRDQLQDIMALIYTRPDIARAHILLAAGRQFPEGDVQHWWQPPTGRGVRTRFSDDRLWLPYVTNFYIKVTGDRSLLDQDVPFIEAPSLAPDEMDCYSQPHISNQSASLFEHCARALDHSLAVGAHGLPFIGTGDWNDGMNRVGHKGKGESVWVGWFLYKILAEFSQCCDTRGENDRAQRYRKHMSDLKLALEEEAWDGNWYVRAFFDDGTLLGSAQNDECRIDSIAQSWAVISGAADMHHAQQAMAAVEQHLILRGDGLVLLLSPPFNKSALDPGYIKGYVPGVRENGGQYTHAALWTLIAYAMLGDGDRAGELFAFLNPINHACTRADLHRYKVEPYVAAADVYNSVLHTGRGGWTWYTGAAGWMYRAGLESILGFKLRGERLTIEPCIPHSWPGYELTYRKGKAQYHIKVENPHHVCHGVATVEMDGALLPLNEITLVDDDRPHEIRIVLGEQQPPQAKQILTPAEKTERVAVGIY
jgi:cyclic beta-1,2-glucan synthetase